MNFLSEEASVHVQGDIYSYKSTKQSTNAILIDIVFSFCFPIPFLGRIFHIIYLFLDHLHPTFVDHLSPYLSSCPIKHLL